MSRYTETMHALSAVQKETDNDREAIKEETLKQIAISLARLVDILEKQKK